MSGAIRVRISGFVPSKIGGNAGLFDDLERDVYAKRLIAR